jgi:hypothetical protein
MRIVDTARQDEIPSINRLTIKTGDAFVLIHVCNSTLSFEKLDKWNMPTGDVSARGKEAKMRMSRNKCDLERQRLG